MNTVPEALGAAKPILFVCLHGSAKSVIAAEYFNRFAAARGLAARAESAGVEPDANVPPAVIAGLAADGIDVENYAPRQVTAERLAGSDYVVSFGCDLRAMVAGMTPSQQWDDLPMVSDGFAAARDAIVARVRPLVDAWSGLSERGSG